MTCLFISAISIAQSNGSLHGKIMDKETKEPIPFAAVKAFNTHHNLPEETISNESGVFNFYTLPKGKYTIQIDFVGYEKFIATGVLIEKGKTTFLDFEVGGHIIWFGSEPITFSKPLFDKSSTTIETTFSREDIQNMPYR